MKVAVELQYLRDRLVHIVRDDEKLEIVLVHKSHLQQVFVGEVEPRFPVVAARRIDHHQRQDARLAGLHQREHFESFVERAETTRKKRDRVCFFYEVELSGEEIVEVNQLRVAFDDDIGLLLERQPDVQAETALAS